MELLENRTQCTPTAIEALAVLAQTRWFHGLSAEAQCEIAQCALELTFPANADLFVAGEFAYRVFVLAKGRVKLSMYAGSQPVVVHLAGPGELCGYSNLLRGAPYGMTATAAGEVRALALDKASFESCVQRFPTFACNLLSELACQIDQFRQYYVELTTVPAAQRLARTLLRLSSPAAAYPLPQLPADIPLSQAELGQITGLSLFTVNRLLSQWDRDRLVRRRRRGIVVESALGLCGIAQAPASALD